MSPVPMDGAVIEPKVSVFVPPVGVIWTVPAPAEMDRMPMVSVLPGVPPL